jgi:hypothetical protein
MYFFTLLILPVVAVPMCAITNRTDSRIENATAVQPTDDEAFQLVWHVASSHMELSAIAERLRFIG